MSNTTYTRGLWQYDETTLLICRLIVSIEEVKAFQVFPKADDNHAIAYIPCDVERAEQEANARLIVAAPDLLDAVKLMHRALVEWAAEFTLKTRPADWGVINRAYDVAERVIAKAERRP